jgi:hypothetical protein
MALSGEILKNALNTYTAPIYLANLALTKHTPSHKNWEPNPLVSFKVLEIDNQLDNISIDSLEIDNQSSWSIRQRYNPDEAEKLIALREKPLHEKAEHLLGRSYRNCVMHSKKEESVYSRNSSQQFPMANNSEELKEGDD